MLRFNLFFFFQFSMFGTRKSGSRKNLWIRYNLINLRCHSDQNYEMLHSISYKLISISIYYASKYEQWFTIYPGNGKNNLRCQSDQTFERFHSTCYILISSCIILVYLKKLTVTQEISPKQEYQFTSP